jgi:translocation and assembly module TamB
LRLHAQELLLEPRRGTRIHVVPDITVELDPALASISGEVRIPKADIDLEALPETAVSVSRDTVMVGQQKAAPGIDYALSVKLSLGKQVHLRGFGADASCGCCATRTRRSRAEERCASSKGATPPMVSASR